MLVNMNLELSQEAGEIEIVTAIGRMLNVTVMVLG